MTGHRQRGLALLTAVLVVALGSFIVLSLSQRGELGLARTNNILRGEQAQAYFLGLEAWAIHLLHDDYLDQPDLDTRSDRWHQSLPPLPVQGGMITGQLEDLSGRFNLNNLARPGSEGALDRERFLRLLVHLRLSPDLLPALLDWLDEDSETRVGGAEDLEYQLLSPPRGAGNRPLTHISELRLVRGFDEAIYQRLLPHVSALPPGTQININTATEAVLASLVEGLDRASIERIQRRALVGYRGVSELAEELAGQSQVLNPAGLSVVTEHFLARAYVELDGRLFRSHSVLARRGPLARVLWRGPGLPAELR